MLIYTFFLLSWNMRPNKGNSDDDNDVSGNFLNFIRFIRRSRLLFCFFNSTARSTERRKSPLHNIYIIYLSPLFFSFLSLFCCWFRLVQQKLELCKRLTPSPTLLEKRNPLKKKNPDSNLFNRRRRRKRNSCWVVTHWGEISLSLRKKKKKRQRHERGYIV